MKKALFIFLLALAFSLPSFACTTAIVSAGASSTGRPLLWKQRDTGNPFNTLVFIAATDTSYAYTALFNVSDNAYRNAYAGSNERGFAIVNNMSYNIAVADYDAKNGEFMRRALERCATVDEFAAFLDAENPRRIASNFGVIDADGSAAYFEAADSSITRFDVPEGGWLVRSNYSLSGRDDEPSGYARYETAFRLMSRHHGKFTPHFLVDGLGRSFFNAALGYDASARFRKGRSYDEDFIPRPTSTSSICFDGAEVIWAAVGYTPACYAVPVLSCSPLPECLSEANALADSLKHAVHPLPRDGAKKYVDFSLLRPVLSLVRRYEKSASSLVGKNEELDLLFDKFKNEFK